MSFVSETDLILTQNVDALSTFSEKKKKFQWIFLSYFSNLMLNLKT